MIDSLTLTRLDVSSLFSWVFHSLSPYVRLPSRTRNNAYFEKFARDCAIVRGSIITSNKKYAPVIAVLRA